MQKFILLFLISFFLFSCSQKPQEMTNTGGMINNEALSGENISTEYSFSGQIFSGGVLVGQELTFSGYDFEGDDSLQKFVNNEISFTTKSYVPSDLEKFSGEFIIDTKGNQTLRAEAKENLEKLSQAFYEKFGKKMMIISAYRSYNYQVGIKNRGCSDLFCAKAGYSEHQSGLAFDMFEASSQEEFLSKPAFKNYFDWMKENAHLYGFHNTYQKGKNIDGYAVEPWHWRYLGQELATKLKNEGKTFAEYVNEN